MADTKISALSALTGANVASATDVLPIVDTSVTTTKKITRAELFDISDSGGGQIKFPGTQNASTNANTLDDYEEGSWTPVLAFGGASVGLTYTTQVGRYIKIGKAVHVSFNIVVNDNGSSTGAATITGLVHAAETITGMVWSVAGYAEGLSSGGGLICTILSGGTSINLAYADATGAASLSETQIVDGAQLACSITYQAAA